MTYAGADNNGYDVFEYTVSSAGTTLPTGDYGYTSRCTYDGTVYWYGDYNDPSDGTLRVFAPSSLDNQSALWVDRDTLAWNPAFKNSITTYELHTDLRRQPRRAAHIRQRNPAHGWQRTNRHQLRQVPQRGRLHRLYLQHVAH